MFHFKFFILTTVLALSVTACTSKKSKKVSHYTEPEVAKIVSTVNEGEISLARRALAVSSNPEVKNFAQHMINDHTKNNKKTIELAVDKGLSLQDSSHSEALQEKSEESMEKLNRLTGKDFDKEYIKNQIATHEQVLNDLNKNLIPSAKDNELRTHLTMTAEKVQSHLNHAKQIQKTL